MREPLALVHDYLTQRGGAERVVATWCTGFPNAPLYTSLYDPDHTFPEFRNRTVVPSWLNRIKPFRQHHRLALPLLAPTIEHWAVNAEVVLASSSGWAHGIKTDGRLVVYCHAPARWLYQTERYLRSGSLGGQAHLATQLLKPALLRWDQRAAKRADSYLANSTFTRDIVRDIYGIDAEVLAPPVATPTTIEDREPTADVIVVARLLPYKNLDVVLATAGLMPSCTFRIVGDGPLRDELRSQAPANVTFVGAVDDKVLWHEYAAARVHLTLSHEDFGITPLEAAAAGRPTIARNSGGFLDTINETTGILIDEQHVTADTVRDALLSAFDRSWDERALKAHAATFSPLRHLTRLSEILDVPFSTPQ